MSLAAAQSRVHHGEADACEAPVAARFSYLMDSLSSKNHWGIYIVIFGITERHQECAVFGNS